MKSIYRFFLASAILVVAFLSTPLAFAETGTQNAGIQTTITNNVTSTVGSSVITVDGQSSVGLLLKFQGTASGTDNIVLTLVRSVDGTTFETTPTVLWTNALNGTTAVVSYREFSELASARAFKVSAIQNASSAVLGTNASLTVIKKTIKASP